MFLASRNTTPARTSTASTGTTYEPTDRRALYGDTLTFVATGSRIRAGGGGTSPGAGSYVASRLPDDARGRRDRLDGYELLPGLAIDRDRHEVRVAGLRDREVAEDPVVDRDAEDRARHRCAVTAVGGDSLEQHEHRLRAVCRVRVRHGADRPAEALDERPTEAGERVRRSTRNADVRAVGDRTVCVRVAEAVRHQQLDAWIDGLDVLHELRAVVARDAAKEHGGCARGLDRIRERLIARLLGVPALEGGDVDAELLRGPLERRRDTEAVRLLVVQDVHLLDA